VEKSSDSLQAARLDAEAALIGKKRLSRHWLLRVYTDLRTFQTNDPLTISGGTLLQREARSSDFMTREKPDSLEGLQALTKDPADLTPFIRPDTLNHPGMKRLIKQPFLLLSTFLVLTSCESDSRSIHDSGPAGPYDHHRILIDALDRFSRKSGWEVNPICTGLLYTFRDTVPMFQSCLLPKKATFGCSQFIAKRFTLRRL
jgi:hypothetical protein